MIPIDALRTDAEGEFVYRRTAGGFEKVKVLTAERNADYVVIVEGLDEGDRIALTNPFADEEQEDAVELSQEGGEV